MTCLIRVNFGINHALDFQKFWNCSRFTRAISKFLKKDSGNLSQIGVSIAKNFSGNKSFVVNFIPLKIS